MFTLTSIILFSKQFKFATLKICRPVHLFSVFLGNVEWSKVCNTLSERRPVRILAVKNKNNIMLLEKREVAPYRIRLDGEVILAGILKILEIISFKGGEKLEGN